MATSPATDLRSPGGPSMDGILLAEELLDLAERAQAYTNAAGVAIALRRGAELLVRTSTGAAPEVGTVIPTSDGFIADCLKSRRPLICRDAELDTRVGKLFRELKSRSLIAVPMCEHREAKGVMIVLSSLPNAFQPTHTAILMTLSDIIASKLAAREAMSEFDVALVNDSAPVAAEPPAPAVAPEIPKATARPAVSPEMPKPAPRPAVASEAPKSVPKPIVIPQPPKPARVEAAEAAPSFAEKPVVPPAAPAISPALLRSAAMPLPEEKPAKREPGLLSPSEDPGLFEHPVTPSPESRPGLVSLNTKPAVSTPAFAGWETPVERSKRPILLGAGAVVAVAVVVAGMWIYRTTSKEVPVPAAAIPAPAAIPMPPSTVAAVPLPAPVVLKSEARVQPPAANLEQSKSSNATEPSASAEPKRHAPTKVIEIAPAQPKQESEMEVAAPKLSLASNDAAVRNLTKLPVALPSRAPSELVPATLVSRVAPSYPQIARQMGIAGSVIMTITVSPQGTVSNVHVISGPGQLRGAAVEAVRQWKYKPALLNGTPTESSVEIQINFAR